MTDDDSEHAPHPFRAAAAVGALGIVYGDIGTSPLYALKEAVKAAMNGAALPASAAVTGAVSVILWSLVLVVSLKYALLIMRADNRGEGGVVAMLALLRAREAKPGTLRALLLVVGLIGAALLYGDGAITPAISVLSAVEGLKVDAPSLTRFVVPITIVVLIVLFFVQSRGTGFIGRVFGPIMLLWFGSIGLLGAYGIAEQPEILAALNPWAALGFMLHAPASVSFAILGAAFLAVTGGEAMYADMGHFGASSIRVSWFVVVLPCLVLNYFGQGGLLLADPSAIDNPFYQLAPGWAHIPLVLFATAATVIASQAIISGAFSLTQQSIQLGFLPRMHIAHTASDEIGQIYIPLVNWLLAAATLGAVLGFGSSDALAGAYGIAVSALMAITTVLAAMVAIQWGYPPLAVYGLNGFFFAIDLVFFGANATKLFEGGWFPLLLALTVAFLMLTWRRGTGLLEATKANLREPEEHLLATCAGKLIRLPGTAAYLSAGTSGLPLPLSEFVRTNHALQERVVIVSVVSLERPSVGPEHRAQVVDVGAGISRLILRYGFDEAPSVPAGVKHAAELGLLPGIDPEDVTYFVGRETIIPIDETRGFQNWRKTLFAFLKRNSERTAAYFGVPAPTSRRTRSRNRAVGARDIDSGADVRQGAIMQRTVLVNGDYVPLEEARVPIMDRGFLFADGIYEVSAVLDGALVDNADHLARLDRSLGEIGIANPYDIAAWERFQKELIDRNELREGTVYIEVTRGVAERDFAFAPDLTPTVVMFTQARRMVDTSPAATGVAVVTAPDIRWERRDIKSIGLLAQVLAKRRASEAGVAEVFMVEDGFITEGGSSTAFIVARDGSVVTRPLSHAVLPGVTRRAVARLAQAQGLSFVERAFTPAEASAAVEVFITSASNFVMPVVAIDGGRIGNGEPGPIATRLRAAYVDQARAHSTR